MTAILMWRTRPTRPITRFPVTIARRRRWPDGGQMVRGGLSGVRASDAQYRESEEPFTLTLLRIGEDFLYGVKPGRYGPDAPPLHPAYALAPALLRELASL